ncbi:hypothetical protein HDZ31DRAFT_41151 [Schizophyllum fasciatum]
MDILPAELWHAVFEYACTDDGRTGASLALVSSYARLLSHRYRLQSIAVRGRTQLAQLARRLGSITLSHRPRILFVSLSDTDGGHTAPPDADRVIELVAPVIQVLHLQMLRVARISLPACPRLSELTIHGPLVEANQQFPVLRKLRLSPSAQRQPAVLRDIRRLGPDLQQIYIPLRIATPHDVMTALGIAPRNADGVPRAIPDEASLFKSLEVLALEEDRLCAGPDDATCPRQRQLVRKLRGLAEKDTRLRVAPRILHDEDATVGSGWTEGMRWSEGSVPAVSLGPAPDGVYGAHG